MDRTNLPELITEAKQVGAELREARHAVTEAIRQGLKSYQKRFEEIEYRIDHVERAIAEIHSIIHKLSP